MRCALDAFQFAFLDGARSCTIFLRSVTTAPSHTTITPVDGTRATRVHVAIMSKYMFVGIFASVRVRVCVYILTTRHVNTV